MHSLDYHEIRLFSSDPTARTLQVDSATAQPLIQNCICRELATKTRFRQKLWRMLFSVENRPFGAYVYKWMQILRIFCGGLSVLIRRGPLVVHRHTAQAIALAVTHPSYEAFPER